MSFVSNIVDNDALRKALTGSASVPSHETLLSKMSAPKVWPIDRLQNIQARTSNMHASSARRGNSDLRDTGIVPFTVQPNYEVMAAGDPAAMDVYQQQVDLSKVQCVDCSRVSHEEFMSKCVMDMNVGLALLNFSQCNLKANRHVNQDAGARQIDRTDERVRATVNLTNQNMTDSSRGGPDDITGATGTIYASRMDPAGMLGDHIYASKSSDPLGDELVPAQAGASMYATSATPLGVAFA
jgi:hypothetical protein